ncbi:MAG: NUDIX hydrolase [Gemmatimonadaceae bacterium]
MTGLEALLGHPQADHLARSLAERPGATLLAQGEEQRRAAVAVILRAAQGPEGDLELLMIKRSECDGDPWSGHVALPGGREEPGDRDLEATALRETWEETGVDIRANGRVLGALDDLGPRSQTLPPLTVRPFVAIVASDVILAESPEVAEAFWVPLAELKRPAQWVEATVFVRGEDRIVASFRHGAHTVWGMTERILRELLARLD